MLLPSNIELWKNHIRAILTGRSAHLMLNHNENPPKRFHYASAVSQNRKLSGSRAVRGGLKLSCIPLIRSLYMSLETKPQWLLVSTMVQSLTTRDGLALSLLPPQGKQKSAHFLFHSFFSDAGQGNKGLLLILRRCMLRVSRRIDGLGCAYTQICVIARLSRMSPIGSLLLEALKLRSQGAQVGVNGLVWRSGAAASAQGPLQLTVKRDNPIVWAAVKPSSIPGAIDGVARDHKTQQGPAIRHRAIIVAAKPTFDLPAWAMEEGDSGIDTGPSGWEGLGRSLGRSLEAGSDCWGRGLEIARACWWQTGWW